MHDVNISIRTYIKVTGNAPCWSIIHLIIHYEIRNSSLAVLKVCRCVRCFVLYVHMRVAMHNKSLNESDTPSY